jgi:phenylalanyl-tRNA synthetase beta chain
MRHEKGISADLPRFAADRAAALMAEITGARVALGIVDNDPGPHERRVVGVSPARTSRLLGFPVDQGAMVETLTPLGFEVGPAGDEVAVTVPLYRQDVVLPADVAEEVARAHGYDRIPAPLPAPALPLSRPDPSARRHVLRRTLAGMGLDEVVTHALIGPAHLSRTGFDAVSDHVVAAANPLSEEHSILRPVPYPSVFAALAENVRQRRTDLAVFEVGKIYRHRPAPAGELAQAGSTYSEAWTVGIGLLGAATDRYPGEASRPWDVADLKGIVDALHAALGVPAPGYRPETPEELHPHLHPGRAARIVDATGRHYGSLGEAHPTVTAAWDLPHPPIVGAIHLDPGGMFGLEPRSERAGPVPAAQPVDRDLAVVVDEATPLGELLRITRQNGGPLLASASLFDVYRGPQIGEGRVSYAIALRFQPITADDEPGIARAVEKIGGALRHHLGAEIR